MLLIGELDVYHHNSVSFAEVFGLVCSALLLAGWVFVMLAVSYGLWTVYSDCVSRMHLHTERLRHLLTFALEHTRLTVLSPGANLAPDFVSELHAWLVSRTFYTDLAFPLLFGMCTPGLLVLFLVAAVCSIILIINFYSELNKTSFESVLGRNWATMYVMAVCCTGLILAVRNATLYVEELEDQQTIIRKFLIDARLLHITEKLPQDMLSHTRARVRALSSKLALRTRTIVPPAPHVEWSEQALSSFCDIVGVVQAYNEKHDRPPRVLGVPVTPLLLRTLIGYLVSSVGAALLLLLKEYGNF